MTVTVEQIQRGLPQGAPAVDPEDIQASIDAWTSLVRLRAGNDMLLDPLGQSIVRLGAEADARGWHDTQEMSNESPMSEALRKQANLLLDKLDEITSDAPGDGQATTEGSETLIKQLTGMPYFNYPDAFNDERTPDPWKPRV